MPDITKVDKSSVVGAIKRNLNILNSVVLLSLFIILFVNIKLLYEILNYVPSASVVVVMTILSGLVLISLYLSKIISSNAVAELTEYDKKLTSTIESLQQEITKRKQIEKKLKHGVLYDSLTNLPNRTLLKKRLNRVIKRPKKHKNYLFAILFVDLDRFKIINDSLGHIVGDQLLIAFAQRLETCIRSVDTIARFGGDEFVILLDDVSDVNDATFIADRLQKKLLQPFKLNGHDLYTTASIGIALSTTGYHLADDVLRDADSAMYRAKALGRARYEIFDSSIHISMKKSFELETDLWQAVERMEFLVYYQPIVSVKNGTITGVEALLRWEHPEHGFIPPAEFIPLAEETGLISSIGEWVLRTACAQNKEWQDAGYQGLQLDVNFSARQFHHQNLPELIKNVLEESGLPARSLHVEITESIAMEYHSIKVLNELTDMGIQTSIDDFGIGYSSLGAIKNFPINVIKVDKSFIKDISIDANVEAIVKAIIAMAHSLKIKVIAEGVETEKQMAFLRSHKCDEMQGYLFSPPVSAKEFTELLTNESAKSRNNGGGKKKTTRKQASAKAGKS